VDHAVPLFTHKQITDRAPGEHAFDARVQDPKNLSTAEADYIARKGAQGFFAWKPDTCMDHEFTSIEIVARKGGGTIQTRGEQVFGCKWCRGRQNNGLQGEAESPSKPAAESVAEVEPAPPAITTEQSVSDAVACTVCGDVMSSVSKSGRPRTKNQQLHGLKLHMKKHQ